MFKQQNPFPSLHSTSRLHHAYHRNEPAVSDVEGPGRWFKQNFGYAVTETSSRAETLVDFDISYGAAQKKDDDSGSSRGVASEMSDQIGVNVSKILDEPGVSRPDKVVSWLDGLVRVRDVK
jgi:hypothetical protein